ncbi:hypothetical protein H6785_02540 [Candidatus Nomurabacteria bacterium]|nr:VPLPA-CTERM sorting domain-containing protein [Candidatus Kaiserbacteria bacterium]MCB9815427.1 hypothetical protein [Candidatus Nomurabacteria bacterium]
MKMKKMVLVVLVVMGLYLSTTAGAAIVTLGIRATNEDVPDSLVRNTYPSYEMSGRATYDENKIVSPGPLPFVPVDSLVIELTDGDGKTSSLEITQFSEDGFLLLGDFLTEETGVFFALRGVGYSNTDPIGCAFSESSVGLGLSNWSCRVGISDLDGVTGYHEMYFIETSTVPVPAAAWLFGSAVLGLIGVSRRRRTSSV